MMAYAFRDTKESKEDWYARGEAFFGETYGETAAATTALLNKISPDFGERFPGRALGACMGEGSRLTWRSLGYFCIGPAYGFVYAFEDVLSKAETSFMMISGLIAIDTPRQINWCVRSPHASTSRM
jgi:hypothetical protein